MKQLGFFDLSDHLQRLSETGDPLETMARVIDFEAFRPALGGLPAGAGGGAGVFGRIERRPAAV